ncbi:MAG TPA: hypothetical protein VGB30_12340 [bacterium]|jgi:hypothetical protein
MPAISYITTAKEIDTFTEEQLFGVLDERAMPVAREREIMRLCGPAVYKLHTQSRTLEFDLTAKNLVPKRMATAASLAFSEISTCYVILAGVSPGPDSPDVIEHKKELDFAKKMTQISFRILKESGGGFGDDRKFTQIPEFTRKRYAEEIAALRKSNPIPAYSLEDDVKSKNEWLGCLMRLIFFAIVMMFTEVGEMIIEILNRFFSGD